MPTLILSSSYNTESKIPRIGRTGLLVNAPIARAPCPPVIEQRRSTKRLTTRHNCDSVTSLRYPRSVVKDQRLFDHGSCRSLWCGRKKGSTIAKTCEEHL